MQVMFVLGSEQPSKKLDEGTLAGVSKGDMTCVGSTDTIETGTKSSRPWLTLDTGSAATSVVFGHWAMNNAKVRTYREL